MNNSFTSSNFSAFQPKQILRTKTYSFSDKNDLKYFNYMHSNSLTSAQLPINNNKFKKKRSRSQIKRVQTNKNIFLDTQNKQQNFYVKHLQQNFDLFVLKNKNLKKCEQMLEQSNKGKQVLQKFRQNCELIKNIFRLNFRQQQSSFDFEKLHLIENKILFEDDLKFEKIMMQNVQETIDNYDYLYKNSKKALMEDIEKTLNLINDKKKESSDYNYQLKKKLNKNEHFDDIKCSKLFNKLKQKNSSLSQQIQHNFLQNQIYIFKNTKKFF